jgi:uncharacterized protein HemY
MIKHIFALLVLSILCIGCASLVQNDPGYILIVFHDWQIQTSLVIFTLSLIFSMSLIYTALRLLLSGLLFPSKLRHILQMWQQKRIEQEALLGIEAYIHENWDLAYKKLEKHPHHPWYLHILAAQAGEELRDDAKRNLALKLAGEDTGVLATPLLIAQAKMQIKAQQFEQAQASLAQIPHEIRSKLVIWDKLQAILDFHFDQPEAVLIRLESQSKRLIKESWYLPFYQTAVLRSLAQTLEPKVALRRFKALPKALQTLPKILEKFSPWIQTEKIFQKQIEDLLQAKNPSKECIQLLSTLAPNATWITSLEQKLTCSDYPAEIHYCLGKWYAQQQLWGQALSQLKQSQTQAAYVEMARIYLELQQTANAMQAMQQALKIEIRA